MKKYIRGLSLAALILLVSLPFAVLPVSAAGTHNAEAVEFTECRPTRKGPHISWKKIPGASEYEIYRKEPGGKRVKIDSVPGDTFSYTDKDVKQKLNSFAYSVRATIRGGGKSALGSARIDYVPPAKIQKIQNGADNSVVLSWAEIRGASGYAVYRKADGEGSYRRIAFLSGGDSVSFTDRGKKASGKTYSYTVRAQGLFSGKKVYGASGGSRKILFVSAPVIDEISWTDDGVNIWWKKTAGAGGYSVFRAEATKKGHGRWKNIGEAGAGKTKFTDRKGKQFGNYYYTVKAQTAQGYGSYSPYRADLEKLRWDGLSRAQAEYVRKTGNAYLKTFGYRIDKTLIPEESSWTDTMVCICAGTRSSSSVIRMLKNRGFSDFYSFQKKQITDHIDANVFWEKQDCGKICTESPHCIAVNYDRKTGFVEFTDCAG